MKEKISYKIREYLDLTIQTKRGMRKRIYQLEEETREAHKNEKYAIEQMNKYKEKLKKMRKEKKKCIK